MRFFLFFLIFYPILFFGQYCDSLLLESISSSGPFMVSEINENSGIRNGPEYKGSTIYFPEYNTNLSSIIMIPGFMNSEATIQNWGPFLASHGILTMTIGTNYLTDSHIDRRDALLDAIVSLKQENQRIESPLFGRIDTSSISVGGFSKGGGGAQLVPSINSNIKSIVALYPWLESPSAIDLNHNIPVIIISGQLDVIAPPSVHADIHYALTPNTTKKLKYEVAFATHDALSGPYGGFGDVGVKVVSWLNSFLLGDSCYCPLITSAANTSSSYITNVICDDIFVNSNYLLPLKINNITNIKDLFGRKVNPFSNTPLLYFYNDGSVEKILIKK